MALHAYSITDSTNTDEQLRIAYRLAVIAGVIGALATWLIGIASKWGLPTALGAPSTLVIYLLIVQWFDKSLWRTVVGSWFGVTTPNLNGTWRGTVNFRTQDGRQLKNDSGEMTIQQNWRTIGIRFQTDKTLSHTDSASIIIQANQAKVIYQYKTEKRRPDQDDFPDHSGTGILRIDRHDGNYDKNNIEGTYYTDHRETGTIKLAT